MDNTTNFNREELIKLGMKTNTDEIFSKLMGLKQSIFLTYLEQKDNRLSTHLAMLECHNEISPIVERLIKGYSGLYYQPNIRIDNAYSISTPIEYIKKYYEYIKESKVYFTDSWIHNDLDSINRILAQLLFKLKFVK